MSNYSIESIRTYKIWDRDCEVNLIFDCYAGEEIDNIQREAILDFESHLAEYANEGLSMIKTYLVKYYKNELEGDTISNIFKYVVPKTIYVSKDPKKQKVIGLLCHFKFDDEDGLAVKYIDGKATEVGGEQIVL